MYPNEGAMVGQGTYGADSLKMIHAPSLQQRLDMAVEQAKERLREAEEARDILSRNPDLERLLNIMQKGRF